MTPAERGANAPRDPSRAEVFEQHRVELTRLAYRMTGSRAEAEDLVQEAWLRFADQSVEHPRAWLNRVLTRLCLDHLKSARTRRETYPGPWLPEPVVELDPTVELAEDLTLAVLVALERLSPLERAAYLLHEVYDYGYDEIGQLLDRSPTACRQLASRARGHVHSDRSRFAPPDAEQVVQEMVGALLTGDHEGVIRRLRADAVFTSDAGGKATAATRPVVGAEKVARMLEGLHKKGGGGAEFQPARVGGLPGFVGFKDGRCTDAIAFVVQDGLITAIYSVRNPDKLGRI